MFILPMILAVVLGMVFLAGSWWVLNRYARV
jgi:hypothetical protein